jgi:hypothetical protein
MTMTQRTPRSQTDSSHAEAPMEQVREILFGAQLKDMEVRFQRQEERLLREIHEVKDSLRKRLDSLEHFMKSEVSSLLGRLKEEQNERAAALKDEQRERSEAIKSEQRDRAELLAVEKRERTEAVKTEQRERTEALSQMTGDLLALSETFDRRAAKLSDALDATERELRELFMVENGRLTDKIEAKYNDALSVLSKTAAQIRSDMVYRTALSTMMTETVMSLSKPWNLEAAAADEAFAGDEPPAERLDGSNGSDEYHGRAAESQPWSEAGEEVPGSPWDGAENDDLVNQENAERTHN